MSGSLAPKRRQKKPRGKWQGNPFSAAYRKEKAARMQVQDQGSPSKQNDDAKEVWVMRLRDIVFVQFRNVLFLVQ